MLAHILRCTFWATNDLNLKAQPLTCLNFKILCVCVCVYLKGNQKLTSFFHFSLVGSVSFSEGRFSLLNIIKHFNIQTL